MLVPDRPLWWNLAKCLGAGPGTFYPDKGGGAQAVAEDAKACCNGWDGSPACRVRAQCLAWALTNGEQFGIWGGLSERERRRLRRGTCAAEEAPNHQAKRVAQTIR